MHQSKAERKKATETNVQEDEATKKIFRIFGGFVIAFYLLYILKPTVLGHDIMYTIFVVIIPIIIGVPILIYLGGKEIGPSGHVKTIWQKAGYVIALLMMTSVISFVMLGLFADAAFTYINYTTAKKSPAEVLTVPAEFHKGTGNRSGNHIFFTFLNEDESIKVSTETINKYINEKAVKHRIRLTLRKGIWNHYLVEDWDIVK